MRIGPPAGPYTPQEYYALERTSAFKSEFYEGDIFPACNASPAHSLITVNLLGELRQRLKGKPCTLYDSNLRLKVQTTGFCTYPDLSVYCNPLEVDEEDIHGETFTNPTVLIEVMSPTTEAYDRGFRAENYRRIKTLSAYVLVSEAEVRAETFERQADGLWRYEEARGAHATLRIQPIAVAMRLGDVYDKVMDRA